MATTVNPVYRARRGREAWTAEVLDRRVYAILGTENPDGSVHMVPLMYAFDGERFLFESNAATRKVRNIQARPRARVLVLGPDQEGWVAADGAAHIIRGDEARDLNTIVAGRYLTDAGTPGWQETIAPLDNVTIVLEPERWSAWDLTEMVNAIAAHGYTETEVTGWFHPLDR